MPLIPSDAGLSLKLQNEALLQPVARTPAIPSDLPDLQMGQRFAASIQEVLPDNTYRALVAGKNITLSLPESAKAGDMLELVVLDRTAKTVIAQLAQHAAQGGGEAAEPYQGATLSRAAQLIGTLQTNDLPDLRLGQKFTAKIQEVLQGNSYKALVDGKSVTLSLPESVQAGDTLELLVIDRSPTTTTVRATEQRGVAVAGAAEPYPFTTLSRAGQMIGALITPEGESPPAAPLNRGEPLLAQPPQTGADLAPALGKAVAQSGLFYESHQAQWVAGKLPITALLVEPQGQHSSPAAMASALASALAALAGTQENPGPELNTLLKLPQEQPPGQLPTLVPGETETAMQSPAALLKDLQGKHIAKPEIVAYEGMEAAAVKAEPAGKQSVQAADAIEARPQAAAAAAPSMPDDVRPLVQQQLEAAATQRLIWHGEVWPGQNMQWEIVRDQTGGGTEAEAEERWATTLRLTTPRLGEVAAALHLTGSGVRISLATSSDSSAADLKTATPDLEQALAQAGVPLLGIWVKHEPE